MTALADIGPGKWYFDYSGQTIYVSDDPTGHVVETSVARSAFYGGASSVTVQNLIIEKYAIPAQMGAIGDQYSGAGWTVTHNEVRLNHGAGINAGAYALTTSNFIHDNGKYGNGSRLLCFG